MQILVDNVVLDHFNQLQQNVEGGPVVFMRCGPFYRLKDGYRAFINGTQVNFVSYNNANGNYFFYFGRENAVDKNGMPKGTMVKFKLDKLIYEPVIE